MPDRGQWCPLAAARCEGNSSHEGSVGYAPVREQVFQMALCNAGMVWLFKFNE
jgi:hypothetical protein